MTFELEINGRVRRVSVEPQRGTTPRLFTVRVDGTTYALEALPTELGLSLRYVDGGRTVDAALAEERSGRWTVDLPHVTVAVQADGRRFQRPGTSGEAAVGEQRIVAPMPGRVVRVMVKPGDEVAARQGLVIVEAMKMENELTSPKAGRVREVAVSEGASVEAGRLLVIVE